MDKTKSIPRIIVENGTATAVILDIDQYEEMLDRLEEAEDIATLREMRDKPLEFRSLDAFLEEYKPSV